jgi:hypothetical protein
MEDLVCLNDRHHSFSGTVWHAIFNRLRTMQYTAVYCITSTLANSQTLNFQQAQDNAVHCSVLHHLHNSSHADDYVNARKMAILMDKDYSPHTRENDVAYLRRSQKIPTVNHLQQKYMTAEGM